MVLPLKGVIAARRASFDQLTLFRIIDNTKGVILQHIAVNTKQGERTIMYRGNKCIIAILGISLVLFISCSNTGDSEAENANEVDVVMDDYAFAVVDSIPSGWTTFKMDNRGQETHEFALYRLPEDKSYQDLYREIIQPADSLQQLLLEGTIDSTEHEKALAQAYPEWLEELESVGGGGLITPGEVSRTSIKLDPGSYEMSCFIASPNGRRHLYQGMTRSITVTKDSSEPAKPQPDVEVTSSGDDIAVDGSLGFGPNTIAFHVAEPDSEDTDPYSSMYLAEPLDPMQQDKQLRDFDTHDPPTELVGGALAIPAGDTSFVTVDLTTPGVYTMVFPHGDKTVLKELVVN